MINMIYSHVANLFCGNVMNVKITTSHLTCMICVTQYFFSHTAERNKLNHQDTQGAKNKETSAQNPSYHTSNYSIRLPGIQLTDGYEELLVCVMLILGPVQKVYYNNAGL